MRKLLNGIIKFRRTGQASYRNVVSELLRGQNPDVFFIACSDSRLIPNAFASSEPGDLFVFRNVGNLIPPCDDRGNVHTDESEAAAIEFAVSTLEVSHIILCGHSECGAMHALLNNRQDVALPNLRSWLRHADAALDTLRSGKHPSEGSEVNTLSQINVLLQKAHVMSYPLVRERVAQGKLTVHAWWFDIGGADVYVHDDASSTFSLLDEDRAEDMLRHLQK